MRISSGAKKANAACRLVALSQFVELIQQLDLGQSCRDVQVLPQTQVFRDGIEELFN